MNHNRLKIEINKVRIHHPADLYEIMRLVLKREERLDAGKEHFWVLALNNANRILNLELVSTGCATSTVVKPMEVLSIPLQKRAVGVMLVHNHPSGNLKPSEEDKDLTDQLIQACRIMNTPVLDHVIITELSYYSFKESGLLDTLQASIKYVPPYELEKQYYDEMKQEVEKLHKESEKRVQESLEKGLEQGMTQGLEQGLKTGKKEGKQEERLAVAKRLLQEGLNLDTISTSTGLSKKELESIKKGQK